VLGGDVIFAFAFPKLNDRNLLLLGEASKAATNALLIGSINALEANGWPRW